MMQLIRFASSAKPAAPSSKRLVPHLTNCPGSAIARPRIGLALGSGSPRGGSHVGIIDALIEAGIEPDIVCRTSIGSLVGAAYVAGRLGELRQWAVTATWREVAGLIDVRLSGSGLTDGKLIVAFLRELGITEAIEIRLQPARRAKSRGNR